MYQEDFPTLPPLKQNAGYAVRPREPMAHGRNGPRPARATSVSFRAVDEAGVCCDAAAAAVNQPVSPLVVAEVRPREPMSRPLYPARPVMTEVPTDESVRHLSPSERMRLRRIR